MSPKTAAPAAGAGQLAVTQVAFGLISLLLLAPAVFAGGVRSMPQRIAGARSLAWLGLVSYAIFLWHFPLMEMIGTVHGTGAFLRLCAGVLAASVACAAASHYLRVAAPADPVLMCSAALVLDDAIPAQFTHPHTVIGGVPRRWPHRPAGTLAFVVIDDSPIRALRLGTPRPPGGIPVGAHHHHGLVTFRLLTYRAS